MVEENKNLREALSGIIYDNEFYQSKIEDMKEQLQNLQLELKKLKNES